HHARPVERSSSFIGNGESGFQRRTERRRAKIIRSTIQNLSSAGRIDRHRRRGRVDGTREVNVIVLVNTKSRIIHQIDGYESIERSGGVGSAARRWYFDRDQVADLD